MCDEKRQDRWYRAQRKHNTLNIMVLIKTIGNSDIVSEMLGLVVRLVLGLVLGLIVSEVLGLVKIIIFSLYMSTFSVTLCIVSTKHFIPIMGSVSAF